MPLLGRASATDPHLASMRVSNCKNNSTSVYLQTSPELFMKRLLCAGSGSIFSIGKSFREGESSKRHNPEFSMLEWYRIGFDLDQLIEDVANLMASIIPAFSYRVKSYASWFSTCIGFAPHNCSNTQLDQAIKELTCFHGGIETGELDRASAFDLLISEVVEPKIKSWCLDNNSSLFLVDFPACQAAMARLLTDSDGNQVARRFELYVHGVELANGYLELTDPIEQKTRFEQDQQLRKRLDLPEIQSDNKFIEALELGMPECSGVALGLDRLLWFIDAMNENGEIVGEPVKDVDIRPYLLFPWEEL